MKIRCMLKVIYYFTEQLHFIKSSGFNLVFKCVLKLLNLELKGLISKWVLTPQLIIKTGYYSDKASIQGIIVFCVGGSKVLLVL